MVDAKDEVRVLLTSESRSTSSRYEIVVGSEENTEVKIRRIKDGQSKKLMMVNVTSPLKENEMRSFWIEVEKERVLFGSGEKVTKSVKAVSPNSEQRLISHYMFKYKGHEYK